MRYLKLLLAIILISSTGTTSLFAQTKLGAKGAVVDGKDGKSSTDGKKPVKKFGAKEATVEDVDEVVKLPPPPPPSLSRIAISTNAPNAIIFINKIQYKTDNRGVLPKAIDLKPGMATIVVKHPDFEEKTETVALKAGVPIAYPIKLISKYGELVLGGIPENAQVFIDGTELAAEKITREGEEISIERVAVGVRKIKITHPDYITREDELEVKPGEQTADAKGLALALADLTVRSLPGAEVYVDNETRGKVLPDGNLVVNGIKPGERSIRVVKDGYIEQKLTEKLVVGAKTIEVKIQPIPNSGQFSEFFNSGLNKWIAPTDWKVEKAQLIVCGAPKLGFPKGGNFRDLDAQFSLKLLNGKGVAWALHMQDSGKNYYLFYLSGPQGKFPGQLRTYVCRDGKFDPKNFQNSVSTDIIRFNTSDYYQIEIKVRGNKIETFITETKTGSKYPLDVFVDEDNLLTYGNIGFTTVDGEEALIDDLNVVPVETTTEVKASQK